MKLGDFIGRSTKISEISTKSIKFWLYFTKTRFSQNHTGTDFFLKNECRKLKFGPDIPLYGI